MNITEFAMFKKMVGKGGGGGNGGIIDVDYIEPFLEGVENCVYRLTAGFYFCGGSNSYAKKGKTYLVDKLPEVGEPFMSLESGEINAVYYNTSDDTLCLYVSDELAAASGRPAGWHEYNELGSGFRGTVTNCISMESDFYYLLLNTAYFIYKDGKWVELCAAVKPIKVSVMDQDWCGPYELTYTNIRGEQTAETVPAGDTIVIEAGAGTSISISGGYSGACVYVGDTRFSDYDFNKDAILLPADAQTCDLTIFG